MPRCSEWDQNLWCQDFVNQTYSLARFFSEYLAKQTAVGAAKSCSVQGHVSGIKKKKDDKKNGLIKIHKKSV